MGTGQSELPYRFVPSEKWRASARIWNEAHVTAKLTCFSLQSDFLMPAASAETATPNLLGCWDGKQTMMDESPLLIWMPYCCYSSCPDRVFTASPVALLLSGGVRKVRTPRPSRKLQLGFESMTTWRLSKWPLALLLTWSRPWTLLSLIGLFCDILLSQKYPYGCTPYISLLYENWDLKR